MSGVHRKHVGLRSARYFAEPLEPRRLLSTIPTQFGVNFTGATQDEVADDRDVEELSSAIGVGNNDIVQMIDGRYRVYDKYGNQRFDSTLDDFWEAAGVSLIDQSFAPTLEYDPGADRFYTVALDNRRLIFGPDVYILVAVSNSSDPLDGWTGFTLDSGSGSFQGETVRLGFDNDGVYATIRNNAAIPAGIINILVLPKVDLLLATPNINRHTLLEGVQATTGEHAVPITYIDPSEPESAFPPRFVSSFPSEFVFSNLLGTIFNPTIDPDPVVSVTHHDFPNSIREPGGIGFTPDGDYLSSRAIFQNGSIWAVHTVEEDNINKNDAIHFVEISGGMVLLQEQLFSNSSGDFFNPSIAVSEEGDVAIGFQFSGPDPGEYISSYALLGETSGGVTTFGLPINLRAGVATYDHQLWSRNSYTMLDPADEDHFWTVQLFTSASQEFSTQITELSANGILPAKLPLDMNIQVFPGAFAVPHSPTRTSPDALSSDAFIGTQGDIDTFYFGSEAGLGLNFTIEVDDFNSGTANPAVAVYDALTGNLIGYDANSGDGDNALFSFSGVANRRYILAVGDEIGGTGDYAVTIDYGGAAIILPTSVALNASGSGSAAVTISPAVDPDFYRFTTPANSSGAATISLTGLSAGFDGAIWLFDADGNVLGDSFVAGTGLNETIEVTGLTYSTQYYITVLSRSYGTSGTATLNVDADLIPAPLNSTFTGNAQNQLVPHALTEDAIDTYFGNATLNTVNEIDAFYLAEGLTGGASWTITADDLGSATMDLMVAVYRDDTDALVGFDDNSGPGNSPSLTFTTIANIRYIVAVADKNGQTGDVSLTADIGPGTAGTTVGLTAGIGNANLNLASPGTIRFFHFTTPPFVSGTGSVSVTPTTPSLDTALLITDSAGNEIDTARQNNPGAADTANLTGLLASTTYYVTVVSYNYLTSGNATLSITIDAPTPNIPSVPDLINASDSGASNTDDTTFDNTATFTGTADPSSIVNLYADGILAGSAMAGPTGNWNITSDVLSDGVHSITAKATFGGTPSADSPALTIHIDTVAPLVTGTYQFQTFNGVDLQFNENVGLSIQPGDLQVLNRTTSAALPNAKKLVAYLPASNTARWTFDFPHGILPDGNYAVGISAGNVMDLAGNSPVYSFEFFVLAADANRDRIVDLRDMYIMAINWQAPGKVFSQGNFNYDSKVDSQDLGILAGNWQRMLAPLPPIGQPVSLPARTPQRTPVRVITLIES